MLVHVFYAVFISFQLVFVSVGASRPPRKMDGSLPSSCLPSPVSEKLPVTLLIREPHFKKLFMLLEELSKLDFNFSKMVNMYINVLSYVALLS